MKKIIIKLSVVFLIVLWGTIYQTNAQIPVPEDHFGFKPGTDRMLFNYDDLVNYMNKLAEASPEVHWEEIGTTELGKTMYCYFISSEENIQNLEELKNINRKLALNDIKDESDLNNLLADGKAFFLSTLSMHANEIMPVQSFPQIAYELVAGDDPRNEIILENTVAMFIPHNPDGMDMVVDNYNKYKDTPYEGARLPGVYHKYVGHNINRDFVTLHMSENKAVAEVYSTEWYPQAMVERHQMGSTGARFFVSPPHDPIAENVDSEVWNWGRIFGARAMKEMTDKGLEGITVNYLFDDYWPGHTSTSKWKGVVGMLSEGASANLASPIYIEKNEIRFGGKGISENEISINMPQPWNGGWWGISDLIKYELENTYSYLHTSAIYREELLRFKYNVTLREIERGLNEAPHYFILPRQQHDQSEWVGIVNLLKEHGISVYQLNNPKVIDNRNYLPGDVVVPLAQPYRGFIKEILERQKFPERHYTPGGEMIHPYDITTWSLPLHRSVEAIEVNTPDAIKPDDLNLIQGEFRIEFPSYQDAEWAVFTSAANESFKAAFHGMKEGITVERTTEKVEIEGEMIPAGSFLLKINRKFDDLIDDLLVPPLFLTEKPSGIPTTEIKMPRVGVVETMVHDMDGGWTRFLFDQYGIDYQVIRPEELKERELNEDFDVLVFTDRAKSIYMTGKFERDGKPYPLNYPPGFVEGMEKEGFKKLMEYVNNGGNLIAWEAPTNLFEGMITIGEEEDEQEFILPYRNVGKELAQQGVDVPGSLLEVEFLKDHPVTWGMPASTGVFHRGSPIFRTSVPSFDTDRRVLASFPEENILLSGYAENEEHLADLPALIWIKKGEGQMVLSTFNPKFRASTHGTFKILFNSLLLD